MVKLAFLYFNQSKYDEAEPLYQRALAIKEKVMGSVLFDCMLSNGDAKAKVITAKILAQETQTNLDQGQRQECAVRNQPMGASTLVCRPKFLQETHKVLKGHKRIRKDVLPRQSTESYEYGSEQDYDTNIRRRSTSQEYDHNCHLEGAIAGDRICQVHQGRDHERAPLKQQFWIKLFMHCSTTISTLGTLDAWHLALLLSELSLWCCYPATITVNKLGSKSSKEQEELSGISLAARSIGHRFKMFSVRSLDNGANSTQSEHSTTANHSERLMSPYPRLALLLSTAHQ